MASSIPVPFQPKVAFKNSSSGDAHNTDIDVWTSQTNNRNSIDLKETISSKETVPMTSIHSNYVGRTSMAWDRVNKSNRRSNTIYPSTDIAADESSTLASLEAKVILERTIKDIQHIAIVGIIGAILVGLMVIGILTLIFSLQQDVPTGTILLYSGSSLVLRERNDRWLFCNGSEVSRATYQGLFAVVGIIYGPGNGVDTFNLPDFRARFPLGSNASSDTTLLAGGSLSHTITVAELPAHNHDQGSLQTLSDGVHTHTYTDPGHDHGGFTGTAPYSSGFFAMKSSGGSGNDNGAHSHSIPVGVTGITIESSGSHTHTISGSTGTQGQGQPIDMMPPYQTVHYIIRT